MANIDPISFELLVDSAGSPAATAKIYYYETGTTTAKAVYSDAGLTTPVTQPVRASSLGIMPITYLSAGRYKRAVTTSADVSIAAYAADPIDSTSNFFSAASAPSPTYPFLRYHNTVDDHVYRRNEADSAWIDEGTIDSLLNAATVTQELAGTSTAVSSTPDSGAALWQRGTDITTSGGTASLPSTGGKHFNVTGALSAISSAQGGRTVVFKAVGAVTYTHNGTSLILPGAVNHTTVAGDLWEFTNEAAADASGTNWRCTNVEPSDGRIVVAASQALMEAASNTAFPVTPGRVQYHPGVLKSFHAFNGTGTVATLTSHNITSLTDGGAGDYTSTIATDYSSADWVATMSGFITTANNTSGQYTLIEAIAAGSLIVLTGTAGGTKTDVDYVGLMGAGDQA